MSGGRKMAAKYCSMPWEKTREGLLMDGYVWPKWVSSRWDRESAEPLALCSQHASIVSIRGIKLSWPRRRLRHLCQNRRSPYSTDKTRCDENTEASLSLWQPWCQGEGKYPPLSKRSHNNPTVGANSTRQIFLTMTLNGQNKMLNSFLIVSFLTFPQGFSKAFTIFYITTNSCYVYCYEKVIVW